MSRHAEGNRKKAEQLGMPWGTAQYHLRRNIIFHYAKKCGDDTCFKCGGKIEDIDEFTIEHKEPWLDSDPELFWSMDNIAFSHAKCNVRTKREMLALDCAKCGKVFERIAWSIRQRRRSGQTSFYCSARCANSS